MSLIPTTIITGFLGAGKTTLLNQILSTQHGYRIAVIENEYGPENIDASFIVQESAEEIIEMNNGCICCTVRGDLIAALNSLNRKRHEGQLQFDRVIIETTGLADPGPIAQTFFMETSVAKAYLIDGIVTLVDSVHAMQQLDEFEEARRQAAFADKIFLSKTDLVDTKQIETLTTRLHRINPYAGINIIKYGHIAPEEILDLKGFHFNSDLHIHASSENHIHHHETSCAPGCSCHKTHLDDINAFVFHSERPFNPERLNDFLSRMIQLYGSDMMRYKGIVYMQGIDKKIIFQGVQQLMGTDIVEKWKNHEQPYSKMVFIGKNLPKSAFMEGLTACLI